MMKVSPNVLGKSLKIDWDMKRRRCLVGLDFCYLEIWPDTWPSSTSTRSASRLPRQGRRVQSDRPAGRLFRLSSPGSTAPAASVRSATGRSISRRSSRSWPQYDFDCWAVLEWECCLKHPEDGARRRRGLHRRATSSASPRRRSTTSPAAQPTRPGPAHARPRKRRRPDAISGRHAQQTGARPRIRLGMVGGGEGAFIGAVHRIAARLDDQYELVAGALSSEPTRRRASAPELGLAPTRIYRHFEEMAKAEAGRAGRHRGGRHRHAEPHACAGRPRPSSRPASTSSATSR